LVTRVVEADALERTITDIVKTVIAAPQAALRLGKYCIDQGMALDLQGGLALERAAMEENIAQGTWRAGMTRISRDKA
jgi:enoyl-CoA hydratase